MAQLPGAREGKEAWCAAVASLALTGDGVQTARLLASTLAAIHEGDVGAQIQLAVLSMRLGRMDAALAAARRAKQVADGGGDAAARGDADMCLALALAHLARASRGIAASERSKCRAQARALLEPLAAQGGMPGPARAEALYRLSLLRAEGGHYGAAVAAARDALAALAGASASAADAGMPVRGAGGPPLLRPAVLGLIALLLSPTQPRSALQLVDAAIVACPPTGAGAAAADGADGGGNGAPSDPLYVGVTRGLDALLLRIKARLLLGLGDAGAALETLALARQRLSAARGPEGGADAAVARGYALMEATVWRDLASVYAGQGQRADAELCVSQAAALDSPGAETAHAEGRVAEASGNTAAAVAQYKRALALAPANAAALRSLGALLRRQGPDGAAVACSLLADALRYESGSVEGWQLFGEMEAGREAERHLHHALTLASSAPLLDPTEMPLLL